MGLICCQLVKHGRYVAAHAWFEPGAIIALGNAKQHAGDVGALALVQSGPRNVGRVVEVLGSADSIHAVMRGLLTEAGLLATPATAVDEQIDALPQEIPLLAEREDRRTDLVVTIDPPTAKDFDDAIGVERAPDDVSHAWVLWVHIADVSAYVPTGSAIDLAAADRAMSAYVPGTVAPMLPHELSSDLCSLRPGVDRGCVSVRAELADDGEVLGVRFARTVIRSARRLTYDQVDRVFSGRISIDPLIDELLGRLDEVTKVLRERRLKRGALDMALPDVEITLGDEQPESAQLAEESPSHRVVEECMLIANDAVGLRLAQAKAPGIWRVHDHPDPAAILALVQAFEHLSVPTPPLPDGFAGREAARLASQAAALAARHARTTGRGAVTFAPRVLRALQQAAYRAHTGPHSGLATEHYAHFTSPIRRYPDLVNHRSLLQLIGAAADPDEAVAEADLGAIAEHVSVTERELQKLERRAQKITLAHLLYRQLMTGELSGEDGEGRFTGEVNGLIAAGMFVRFGSVYEGFVPARTLSRQERYELDELGLAMVGTSSGHVFRLGDSIDVYVDAVDRATGRIELRRVGTEGGAGTRETRRGGAHRAGAGKRAGGAGRGGGNRRQRRRRG